VAAFALGACAGPKIIPDKELAQIFHDIYLVNGYVGQRYINTDSMNLYEPVFRSYGYTSEDVQYTIGNFSKRKSARLSEDVVEVAVEMLRRESAHYRRRIKIRDTIALIARQMFADTVYSSRQIRVRRTADTVRLRVAIPDIKPGSYRVSYSYRLDSLDVNPQLRAHVWLVDSEGNLASSPTRRLERGKRGRIEFNLTSTAEHRRLVLVAALYSHDLTTPRIEIDSLEVIHFLPDEVAVGRLPRGWNDWKLLDTLIKHNETYLGPPFADTLRFGGR
jgi:hypothetical protein